MSFRQSRGYKTLLVVVSLVFLGGAGVLGYFTFFGGGGSDRGLKAAEGSYKRGEEALGANPQEAFERFDAAAIAAQKGLDAFAAETKDKTVTDEQKKSEGKLNWLLARAVRDRAYAKAKQDGKPLNEATDTTSGKTYRGFIMIPEANDRLKARNHLVRAAELLSDDPEVRLEATRVALTEQPMNWKLVERLMKDTLKADPKDSRANFFLAKLEFEQPNADNGAWIPRPADKREKDRVDEALKYLKQAEENKAPYWRTAHLRADILAFQLAGFKDPTSRSATAKAEDLDKLLGEALEKAVRGEELGALSTYDGNGFIAVQELAMKRATAGSPPDAAKVKRVAETAVTSAGLLAEAKMGAGFVPQAGDGVLDILLMAKRAVAATDKAWWAKITTEAEAFFAKHPRAVSLPGAVGKRTQLAADAAAAMKVLEDGVEAARQAKASPAQLSDLLAELANLKLLANAPADKVDPLIQELRKLNAKQTTARVNYLEGVLAERQGKLTRARQMYNKVFEDKEVKGDSPLTFLTHLRMGPVSLAAGQPGAAAGHLSVVAGRLKSPLTAEEKAWVEQSGLNADDVVALQVIALIRVGLDRMAAEARARPGQPVPGEMKKQTEDSVAPLIKGLRAQSGAERSARLALAEFELACRDKEAAEKQITALTADYPADVTVLRADVARLLLPAEGKKEPDTAAVGKADLRIDGFLKLNPDSRAGKLFKAEWLVRTRRADEAVAFLQSPENFPDKDDVVKRLLAGALLQAGNRDEAKKVLDQLPRDAGVELAVLQAAGSKEEMEKGLKSAIGKYENNGLLRLYDGVLKMNDGKFEEAVAEFRAAGEFNTVAPAATALVQRALIAYAGADRKKATPFIHGLIAQTPDQPGLYQAAALAAKYADDIGAPTDQWGPKKSMYAAANQWAALASATGQTPDAVGMVKVAYHELAGAPLLARQEAQKVVAATPKEKDPPTPAVLYLAQSYLFGPYPDAAKAKEYVDLANKAAKADNPAPSLLEGALLERTGKADDAAKLYERMMTQYPTNPAPYARRVELAANAKQPGEAVSWAKKWMDKMPDDAGALTELVRRLAEAGEADTASKAADEWTAKHLDKAKAEMAGAKPPPPADQQAKVMAGVRAVGQLSAATGLFRAKKYAEAKARVEAVLKDEPESVAAQLMAGDIAIANKDWDTADKLYRERLKKVADDYVAANNLAWVLSEQKNNPAEALKLLDHARLSGNDTPVGVERLPADFIDTYGRVYLKLNTKEHFQAMEKMLDPAVRRYPDDPRLHYLLGVANAGLGVNSKAATSLAKAIELASDPNVRGVPDDQKAETKQAAEAAKAKLGGK